MGCARRGETLLEVLVAVAILMVIFVALVSLLPLSMTAVRQSEHRFVAAALAESILAACNAGPYANLATDTSANLLTPGPLGDILRLQNCTTQDNIALVPQINVVGVPGVTRANLADVTVTVVWQDRTNAQVLTREQQIAALQR